MKIDLDRFSKTEYSSHMAFVMATLSKIQYDLEETIKEKTASMGCENFKFFENESAQGFAVTYGDYILMIFRGTQFNTHFELRDLVNGLMFRLKHIGKEVKAHGGVLENYSLLKDQVAIYIKDHPTKTLVVGGHSLGGGTASLASLEFDCIGYSFGSIRSIKSTWANREKPFFNIINTGDIVAEYPTRLSGLTHYGTRYMMDADGNLSDKKKFTLSILKVLGFIGQQALSPILMTISRSFTLRVFFKPHAMDSYIERLQHAR